MQQPMYLVILVICALSASSAGSSWYAQGDIVAAVFCAFFVVVFVAVAPFAFYDAFWRRPVPEVGPLDDYELWVPPAHRPRRRSIREFAAAQYA